jgi:hypothetical protein
MPLGIRSEKENDTLCTKKGKLTGYKRLTQLIRECRSAGRQDEPNPTIWSFIRNVEARRSHRHHGG